MSRVVDFHTHAFPDRIAPAAVRSLASRSHTVPFADATEDGLRQSMTRSGIDLSVILPVATKPEQVVAINDSALRINGRTSDTGLLSLGCMHPDLQGWHAELGRIAAAGIRGVKLHPVYQGADIDDPRFVRILARCGELGLFAVLHAGWDIGYPGAAQALPGKILRALRQAGPVRLILAHMGGWRCWDEAEDLFAGTDVMIDTAFSLGRLTPDPDGPARSEEELTLLTPERFVRMIRSFGADRVLFGTDSPWADQAAALAELRALDLTAAEREAILGGNAERLLA